MQQFYYYFAKLNLLLQLKLCIVAFIRAIAILYHSCQQKKLKDAVKVISSGSLLFASYLTVVGDERFYANQLMPLLQRVVGPETAHVLAVKMIRLGLVPRNRYKDPASLVSLSLCFL